MNRPPQLFQVVVTVIILTSFGFCSASSFYITRDGAGSQNGSSLANAAACDSTPGVAQSACAAFNNSANWGSGSNQIGPGTTVYVGGDGVTITATAGASSYMAFQGSGSSGNPIILYLQTELAAPYFCCSLGGGAVNTNGNSYITIDGGGTACGWNTATNESEGTCVGTIQNTANGDGLTYQQESTAISMSNCNNVEIRNLGIYDMYLKTNPATSPVSNSTTIFCDGSGSNFLVHDILEHDIYQSIVWAPGSGTNNGYWYNNESYNQQQAFIEYANSSATITNFFIYGNHIHDFANWDTSGCPPSCPYHHDGIYLTYPNGPPAQTITNLLTYNNIFDGELQGTNQCGGTSYFYLDTNDVVTNGYFFNNVILQTTQSNSSCPGDQNFNFGVKSGALTVFNNTNACNGPEGNPGNQFFGESGGTTTAGLMNNLFLYCGQFIQTYAPSGTGIWNYNVYAMSNGNNGWVNDSPQGTQGTFNSLSTWVTDFNNGADANSIYSSSTTNSAVDLGGTYEANSRSPVYVNLSVGLVPQASSIAHGAGTNLYSSICSTISGISSAAGTACQQDITKSARAPSGAWDVGALQYASGNPVPNPPTGLAAVVQ